MPVSVSVVKERELAPKTGEGREVGVDREAACEFLLYCLTLLKKKNKKKKIKCFDPLLWQLLCVPLQLMGQS